MGTDNMITIADWFARVNAALGTQNTSEVNRILKSGNATIVFWADGTKTIVKRAEDEPDNPYNAFCAALAKKLYGSNSAVKKLVEQKTEYQKKGD